MRASVAALAVVIAAAGCGDGRSDGAESTTEPAALPTASLPPAVDDLFRRYDAIVERPGFDHEQATVHRLPPGDEALYVLWVVDGEINNGGFSQYLFNSTAELHDEAVASAKLIGAAETAGLLERLPRVLGVSRISESRQERQRVLDRLTPEQEDELGRLDEQWFAGSSEEIEAKLIAYVRSHPEAFSRP